MSGNHETQIAIDPKKIGIMSGNHETQVAIDPKKPRIQQHVPFSFLEDLKNRSNGVTLKFGMET